MKNRDTDKSKELEMKVKPSYAYTCEMKMYYIIIIQTIQMKVIMMIYEFTMGFGGILSIVNITRVKHV